MHLRYEKNRLSIDEKMETHAQSQEMFDNYGSDGPTAVSMPFTPPYDAAHCESADQTRKMCNDRLINHGLGAGRGRVEQPTRMTNSKRAYRLWPGLVSVMSQSVGEAANPRVYPDERSRD